MKKHVVCLKADYRFRGLCKSEGIDWNYIATKLGVFVFDLPHSAIPCDFASEEKTDNENPIIPFFQLKRTWDGDKQTVTAFIAESYTWDGASVVPDSPKGVLPGTEVHDPVYQFAEQIAKAFGWTVKEVLAFGDELFRAVMIKEGASNVTVFIYYTGVSWFGYYFHQKNLKKKSS